ncbi:MAG: hypothetical protein JRM79_04040 [Nitrososphaerota archaeon]|jgi:hypothetical protein|nr:hypothetical protein [Nitrososphaerota archaeon]MDG6953121.1 hypothetical protein [Nitrososphaerota archaeon]MDG6958799.1 hypothetical protein [Nitrososphaerota archaeon]MDG6974462.1 hypothetical protein [Nitrososphaerota archaeon]MDG7008765.1 hypothetical protein [Nitrososphaerota archaeon]
MPKGLWVWPSDPQGQQETLEKVAASPHLNAALAVLAKSEEGMSNAELDDATNDSSEWTTIWVVRQLTSLGFIEFRVDLFGNPARYRLTALGRTALSKIAEPPLAVPPSNPQPQQAAASKPV